MSKKALLAAGAAGLVGVIAWYLVNPKLNPKLWALALGLGVFVGMVGVRFGGKGDAFGAYCAVVTALAIVLGQWALSRSRAHQEIDQESLQEFVQLVMDAKDYRAVETDKDLRTFMARHGYSRSKEVRRVTDKEVERFMTSVAPLFEQIRSGEMGSQEYAQMVRADADVPAFWGHFGPFAGCCSLLGLFSAIVVVRRYGD